jgi:hypothetical protein
MATVPAVSSGVQHQAWSVTAPVSAFHVLIDLREPKLQTQRPGVSPSQRHSPSVPASQSQHLSPSPSASASQPPSPRSLSLPDPRYQARDKVMLGPNFQPNSQLNSQADPQADPQAGPVPIPGPGPEPELGSTPRGRPRPTFCVTFSASPACPLRRR